jgi:hypothetical protein
MKEKGKEIFIYRFYKSDVGLQKKKTGLFECSDVEECTSGAYKNIGMSAYK